MSLSDLLCVAVMLSLTLVGMNGMLVIICHRLCHSDQNTKYMLLG